MMNVQQTQSSPFPPSGDSGLMIARIWHGYTTFENADAYENLLRTEIFSEIERKNIKGHKGIKLLRRSLKDEIEFITIMWFDSLEAIKSFAGDDFETAYVPAKAREILKRFDDRSQHYEIINEIQHP